MGKSNSNMWRRATSILAVLFLTVCCQAQEPNESTDLPELPTHDFNSSTNDELNWIQRPEDNADLSGLSDEVMKAIATLDESDEREPGEVMTIKIAGIDTRFRWIPPGWFVMGSPFDESERDEDETEHIVVLTRGFWLAESETSQKLYMAVARAYGGNEVKIPSSIVGDDLPVTNVPWLEAAGFAEYVNCLLKHSGYKVTLPTEAQWEYACRAGSRTRYFWGDAPDTSRANFGVDRAEVKPVGSYEPNAWGLYDMHGNVWEWCIDSYGAYSREAVSNPFLLNKPLTDDSVGVLRGGACRYLESLSRSANRRPCSIKLDSDEVGFRLELFDAPTYLVRQVCGKWTPAESWSFIVQKEDLYDRDVASNPEIARYIDNNHLCTDFRLNINRSLTIEARFFIIMRQTFEKPEE